MGDAPRNGIIPFPKRHEQVPDVREREQAADPRFNVALEASAGTGKTSVLVSRYIGLVEQGASPRHVLAITFTRKAAGEMRARILTELRARAELWKELRDRLFEIHVTTIDAFCLGLLREFPLEAGLDPDIELLDEVDLYRLSEQVVSEALAHAKSQSAPDYAFLVESFGEWGLRRGVRDFLQARLVKEDLLEHYVEKILPKAISLRQSLTRASAGLVALFGGDEGGERFLLTLPDDSKGEGEGESDSPPEFKALRFALRRAMDPGTISAYDIEELARYFLTAKLEPRRKLSSACSKNHFANDRDYQRHRDQVLAMAPRVREIFFGWFEDKDRIAVRALTSLYRDAAERFAAAKARRARLDFTDVLRNAVSLLEKRGEFAQSRFRLESRYHHLLIDEFQDTNEMQWRLLRALIESWGEGAGLVQDAIVSEQATGSGQGRLEEPSIFIVGDRKQSIYGFRDARVEVMERASRQILRIRPKGAHRLKIRKSFRAVPTLLKFINDLFFEMPKATRELAYAFQYQEQDHFPIAPAIETPKTPLVDSDTLAVAVAADRGTVAAAIASEVARLVHQEHLPPRDIAILFRSRTHYRIYEKALNAIGIPTHVYRGLGFFDAPEVRDVQALVRYLAEPTSELRAAELARSRIIGVTDSALYQLVRAGRREIRPIAQWLSGKQPSPELSFDPKDRERLIWAANHVPQWVAETDRTPAADHVQGILNQVDYAGWFSEEEQGWENLKKTLELIRKAHNRGYLTLTRLVEFLERASLSDESLAVIEAAEAVNLMTIHASKGLEFNTVFLVNMEQRTGDDRSLPRIVERADGTYEIHALTPRDSGEDDPSRALEEEKRLLYVATTRAKRRLVLSATLGDTPVEPSSLFGLLPSNLQRQILTTNEEDPESEQALEWVARDAHALRRLRPAPTPETALGFTAQTKDQESAALLLGPPEVQSDPSKRASGNESEASEGKVPPEQMELF